MKLPVLYFYQGVHFRKWDHSTADTVGQGMSETQMWMCAERLAKRGYEVFCFAPLPEDYIENDSRREHNGVHWRRLDEADWSQKGVWFLYRDPTLLDHFEEDHPEQMLISVSQDEFYRFDEAQVKKLTWLFCFCQDHAKQYIYQTPGLKEKIILTSNGLRVDLIREIEKEEPPERDPYSILFASSPDRGLLSLIDIYKRAREFEPRLNLKIAYSFYNIDRLIEKGPQYNHFKKSKDEILSALEGVKDVTWLGGDPSTPITQPQLYREWQKTGFFIYCTNFRETSCASVMECQAMGAIPICSPVWALRENVLSGILIDGDANDPYTKCTFSAELIKVLRNEEFREGLRPDGMKLAREKFNWERVVDGWEAIILGLVDKVDFFAAQFAFQQKYSEGKILNLGCHIDASGFKKHRNALNVDIQPLDNVDIVADARNLPENLFGRFDTVVLGDISEHLNHDNRVKVYENAKKCLRNGGKIIITAPNDNRPHEEQQIGEKGGDRDPREYGDEASPFHNGLEKEELLRSIKEAGLIIEVDQEIDYSWATGYGLVCRAV